MRMPYSSTSAPGSSSAMAILWPSGIAPRASTSICESSSMWTPTTGSPASMSDVATPTWSPRRWIRNLWPGGLEPFSDNDLPPLLAHVVELGVGGADALPRGGGALAVQALAGRGDALVDTLRRRAARDGVRRHEAARVERAAHG